MKHLILITFLTFGLATGFAQLPIKAPTRPTKTAPAAKPRPSAKPKPTRRTSSAGRTSSVPSASVTEGLEIDLGLSVKWASHNVGANSPEQYGRYYGWADPSGSKTSTDESDYPNANPPTDICSTNYDMATQNWGGSWRLPTANEFQELLDNCNTDIVSIKGVKGMRFISKKNGNSIFIPLAGEHFGKQMIDKGSWGYYWTGTHITPVGNDTYCLYMNENNVAYCIPAYRRVRCSVRPVTP